MNKSVEPALGSNADEALIPKAPYLSQEFLQLEKTRLWSKVWLMACRESDVAQPGNYVVFNVADESIVVMRDVADGVLRAFFNICQHRGRRLLSGQGSVNKLVCKYHGWRWNTDGTNDEIIDQADWGGTLSKDDVALKPLKLDTWGGWVFVHMDADHPQSLQDWLAPVVHAFRNYRFEEFSPVWMRSVTLPCNWKVALDVFIEGYHAQTAHRQFNPVSGDNRWTAVAHGVHSMFHSRVIPVLGDPSPNIKALQGLPEDESLFLDAKDRAQKIHTYFMLLNRDTGALFTERKVRAMARLANELPTDASYMDTLLAMDRLHREEGKKDGLNWDQFTLEDVGAVGLDWNIFPNIAFLPQEDGALVYRARPNGNDPDSCVFDIYSLERFAPGKAPKPQVEVIRDWRDTSWPRVFVQDFENLNEIQQGMKSQAFTVGRANPIAELTNINLHYHVRRYVLGGEN
ncbi:aromatic ring-hydroxylating dioxygenase subunit alpha [Paraburkholderia phymatum]|uniref:aromatic ring-hydroxylating oxygenase subunit alpha n=1 Tax=Paraburkholderia phymatum TaxID=148447 RepID=UPI00317464E1